MHSFHLIHVISREGLVLTLVAWCFVSTSCLFKCACMKELELELGIVNLDITIGSFFISIDLLICYYFIESWLDSLG